MASSTRKANITKIRALLCVQRPEPATASAPEAAITPLTLREPLAWHEPRTRPTLFGPEKSDALRLANAMQRLGMLSLDGLRVFASVWSGTRFTGEQTPQAAKALTQATLKQIEAAGLIPDSAENGDVITLHDRWQLPMYELTIIPTVQTLEELREAQVRMLNDEIGGC